MYHTKNGIEEIIAYCHIYVVKCHTLVVASFGGLHIQSSLNCFQNIGCGGWDFFIKQ